MLVKKGPLKKLLIIISNLLLLFLLLACQNQEKIAGVPVNFQRVVASNEIEVLWTKEGATSLETVKLMGIKTPNLKQQPWATQAQAKLKKLLTKNPQSLTLILELEREQPDQFGQFWAYIWYENQLINEQLVKEGWAIVNPCQPLNLPLSMEKARKQDLYCDRLLNAQQYARLMNMGIWAQKNPLRELL